MPFWVTIALMLWGAVGSLVGLVVGHWLSRFWQQKQWLLDNKKQEYRELISAITEAYGTICVLLQLGMPRGPDEQRKVHEVQLKVQSVIADRLFIAGEVQEDQILRKWMQTTGEFDEHREYLEFKRHYGENPRPYSEACTAGIRDIQVTEKMDLYAECHLLKNTTTKPAAHPLHS